jgi:hypothetical protein
VKQGYIKDESSLMERKRPWHRTKKAEDAVDESDDDDDIA